MLQCMRNAVCTVVVACNAVDLCFCACAMIVQRLICNDLLNDATSLFCAMQNGRVACCQGPTVFVSVSITHSSAMDLSQ